MEAISDYSIPYSGNLISGEDIINLLEIIFQHFVLLLHLVVDWNANIGRGSQFEKCSKIKSFVVPLRSHKTRFE